MYFSYFGCSGVGKSPAKLTARGPLSQIFLEYRNTLKFLLGPLGLYTVLLRVGSILRELGVKSLAIIGRPSLIDSRGVGRVGSEVYLRYSENIRCIQSEMCASTL